MFCFAFINYFHYERTREYTVSAKNASRNCLFYVFFQKTKIYFVLIHLLYSNIFLLVIVRNTFVSLWYSVDFDASRFSRQLSYYPFWAFIHFFLLFLNYRYLLYLSAFTELWLVVLLIFDGLEWRIWHNSLVSCWSFV